MVAQVTQLPQLIMDHHLLSTACIVLLAVLKQAPTQFFNSSPPRLSWQFVHEQLRPTGAGCVTNGGRVLCPMVVNGQERSVLISWEALANGKSSWNVTLERPDLPLPVVDITGEVIASNGYKILGFMPDGKLLGKPIPLHPVHGHVMDLSVSSNEYIIILYKCGFLAVYLTNGIPHASIWLNDTLYGVEGTFIPLNTPAINSSSSERLYILTVFRPKSPQTKSSTQELYMRLYGIDVTGSIAYRIQVVWHYDFILPAASFPYTKSNITMCKLSYPTDPSTPDHEDIFGNATMLPAGVLVQSDVVLATVNYIDTQSGDSHCLLLATTDLGKNYSVNFSKHVIQSCHGMAYNSAGATTYALDTGFSNNKQLLVWVNVFDPVIKGSSLLLTDMYSGEIIKNVSLSLLMGKEIVNITSQMLIADLCLGNSTAHSVTSASYGEPGITPVPLIFGITDGYGEASIVAVNLLDLTVIWTLPLPKGHQVMGQISTVDRLRDSLMVFTDQLGVYFFQIS